MLSDQIKARLSEVVTSATAAMESSPTAHDPSDSTARAGLRSAAPIAN